MNLGDTAVPGISLNIPQRQTSLLTLQNRFSGSPNVTFYYDAQNQLITVSRVLIFHTFLILLTHGTKFAKRVTDVSFSQDNLDHYQQFVIQIVILFANLIALLGLFFFEYINRNDQLKQPSQIQKQQSLPGLFNIPPPQFPTQKDSIQAIPQDISANSSTSSGIIKCLKNQNYQAFMYLVFHILMLAGQLEWFMLQNNEKYLFSENLNSFGVINIVFSIMLFRQMQTKYYMQIVVQVGSVIYVVIRIILQDKNFWIDGLPIIAILVANFKAQKSSPFFRQQSKKTSQKTTNVSTLHDRRSLNVNTNKYIPQISSGISNAQYTGQFLSSNANINPQIQMQQIEEVASEFELSKIFTDMKNKTQQLMFYHLLEIDGVIIIDQQLDQVVFQNQQILNILQVEKEQILDEIYKLKECTFTSSSNSSDSHIPRLQSMAQIVNPFQNREGSGISQLSRGPVNSISSQKLSPTIPKDRRDKREVIFEEKEEEDEGMSPSKSEKKIREIFHLKGERKKPSIYSKKDTKKEDFSNAAAKVEMNEGKQFKLNQEEEPGEDEEEKKNQLQQQAGGEPSFMNKNNNTNNPNNNNNNQDPINIPSNISCIENQSSMRKTQNSQNILRNQGAEAIDLEERPRANTLKDILSDAKFKTVSSHISIQSPQVIGFQQGGLTPGHQGGAGGPNIINMNNAYSQESPLVHNEQRMHNPNNYKKTYGKYIKVQHESQVFLTKEYGGHEGAKIFLAKLNIIEIQQKIYYVVTIRVLTSDIFEQILETYQKQFNQQVYQSLTQFNFQRNLKESCILMKQLKMSAKTIYVQYVQPIRHQQKLFQSRINDIIDFGGLNDGLFKQQIETFDLFIEVQKVIKIIKSVFSSKNNQIIFLYNQNNFIFKNDKQRINQILVNILSSLSNFLSNGTITIKFKQKDLLGKISVKDSTIYNKYSEAQIEQRRKDSSSIISGFQLVLINNLLKYISNSKSTLTIKNRASAPSSNRNWKCSFLFCLTKEKQSITSYLISSRQNNSQVLKQVNSLQGGDDNSQQQQQQQQLTNLSPNQQHQQQQQQQQGSSSAYDARRGTLDQQFSFEKQNKKGMMDRQSSKESAKSQSQSSERREPRLSIHSNNARQLQQKNEQIQIFKLNSDPGQGEAQDDEDESVSNISEQVNQSIQANRGCCNELNQAQYIKQKKFMPKDNLNISIGSLGNQQPMNNPQQQQVQQQAFQPQSTPSFPSKKVDLQQQIGKSRYQQ